MIPYSHRHTCKSHKKRKKTIINFFMKDELLYRVLYKIIILDKIDISKDYAAIVGFDLSPRIGLSEEQQKFNILLSQMFTIYLALKGYKILPNFRIGDFSTLECLNSYPKNIVFAVGMRGNGNNKQSVIDQIYFFTKIEITNPKFIYLYGKTGMNDKRILIDLNVPFMEIEDYKSSCLNKKRRSQGQMQKHNISMK